MNSGAPALSVVIPAYRCADTLAADVAALEAVLGQCEPSYEVVVVLDGDGDGGATPADR